MDLLRLAYKNDPKNTVKILNNILTKDNQLIKIAKQLRKKQVKKIHFSKNQKPLIVAEISANHCGSKKSFLNHIERGS